MTTQTFQEIATGANGFESRCTMHPARNLVKNSSKKLLKQSIVYNFINSSAHRLGKLTLIFQATDCGLNTSQTLDAQRSKLFLDWPDANQRRHLMRLWLSIEGDRPLPEYFKEHYGSIEVGNRGGIITKHTKLHAPLD